MKKILIVNQCLSDNLGDQLLNERLCRCLEKMGYVVRSVGYAQTTLQFIDYSSNERIDNKIISTIKKILPPKIKYYLNYSNKLRREIRDININEYCAVIIGGGQLIKHNSVFQYCFSFWVKVANKAGVPILAYGIGVDTGLTKKEIKHYKKYFDKLKHINCRDYKTASLIEKYFNRKASISPDIAFTYLQEIEKTKKNYIVVMPYHYETAKRSFKIEKSLDRYYDDIYQILSDCKKDYYDSRVVLTATTSSDARECVKYKKYLICKGIDASIMKIVNINEMKNLFLKSNVIITGRMHAMILGLLCGAKVFPICISDKIRQFEKEYLLGNIDINQISKESEQGLKDIIF